MYSLDCEELFFLVFKYGFGDAVCRAELMIIMLGEVPRVIELLNAVVQLIIL